MSIPQFLALVCLLASKLESKPERENLNFLYELYRGTFDLKFYSQFEQDRFIFTKFFKHKTHGIFVDIGAHDGITLSNTYFFEKQMGWTGLCIEPIPEIFQQLKTTRTAICIEGCIYHRQPTAEFLRIKGYGEMLSGIIDTNPNHAQRILQGIDPGMAEILTVKCYNFMELLLSHQITHVDYLSIDTEGGELDTLKSIDFDQIKIDVIDVENNEGSLDFEEFLVTKGYKKIARLGPDDIFYLQTSFPEI